MNQSLIKIIGVLALVLIGFTACDREAVLDLETAEDIADIENLMDDVEAETDYQIEEEDASGGAGGNGCPTFSWAQPRGSFPNTLTIDFGTQGCTGNNGRVRTGQIVVNMSAPIGQTGASRTINLVNFTVDSVAIAGTSQLTNNGNGSFTRNITNASITKPDGSVVRSWNATRTWTMTAGMGTPTRLDDEFEVTGSASGVNRNGQNFSSTITSPLLKRRTCRWIVSGTIDHTINGDTYMIDFGIGNCDRIATVTGPNGNTRNILIRR